ncbi:MAG: terpene cyclase/mutase family protein [Nitrospirae bacterium]|nr:terpene cyclase/mutase family protein [Nitrospirota bacterium]
MSKVVKTFLLAASLILLPMISNADNVVSSSKTDVSLKNEVESAIGKGLTWLAAQQKPEGFWSQQEFPALSGLVLMSFQGDPSGYYKKKYAEPINKGYDYLKQAAKPDGSIFISETYKNYNTAVCTTALVVANRPELEGVIKNARSFLIQSQHNEGGPEMGDSHYDGGIGYGRTDKNPDLSNTVLALEALYYSRYLKGEKDPDLNWEAAKKFITRTQHLPGYNDEKWASDDSYNKGGFAYFPGNSRAGDMTLPDGKIVPKAYGSMSYAGLLSYIYAQMDKNDPRIKAVYEWLSKNYSLDANPGAGNDGQDGLYYYYHTMAKGLTLYGVDTLKSADGKTVNWREALAKRLLDLQKSEGFWVNEKSGRWMEKDPVLVTSYSILALEMVWRGM